jgi:hypothetical protein
MLFGAQSECRDRGEIAHMGRFDMPLDRIATCWPRHVRQPLAPSD